MYTSDEIWHPHFDLVNGVVPHEAPDVTIRVFPDGTVKYSERSSAELSNIFNLRKFPFDHQTLEIWIHPTVAEGLVELSVAQGDPISAEPRVYAQLAQWTLADTTSSVEQIEGIGGESISEVCFALSITRRFNFYLWKVILPLILMVVLSWTVFWFDPTEPSSQVQLSVTTILTVIAFGFAIQANLPKVPYLTFSDLFFLTCYLFVFLTAIKITAVHLAGRSGHVARARRLTHMSRVVLPLAFVVINLLVIAYYFGWRGYSGTLRKCHRSPKAGFTASARLSGSGQKQTGAAFRAAPVLYRRERLWLIQGAQRSLSAEALLTYQLLQMQGSQKSKCSARLLTEPGHQ